MIDTYCHGPVVCNFADRKCVPRDPDYDPCAWIRASDDAPEFTRCYENMQVCGHPLYCRTDGQCDDGIAKNGVERCVIREGGTTGTCIYAKATA